jgi:hypothetical protein
MKNTLLVSAACFLLFAACKERDQPIGLTPALSTDSAWMSIVVPATNPHNVLIEEFSGQACPNCPGGRSAIDTFESQNPGRINAVTMYPPGIPQADTPIGSSYDFRASFANSLASYLTGGNVSALPSAYIDRVIYSTKVNEELDGTGAWAGAINSQLTVTDSVNLTVRSSYNAGTRQATITATIVFTKPVATRQNFSVVIVEDSMYSIQEDENSPTGFDSSYLYNGVFRGMASSVPAGDPILSTMAVKPAGQAYERTYIYTLPVTSPAIFPKHCRVIAFVNSVNGSDYRIMQSVQTSLTGL